MKIYVLFITLLLVFALTDGKDATLKLCGDRLTEMVEQVCRDIFGTGKRSSPNLCKF